MSLSKGSIPRGHSGLLTPTQRALGCTVYLPL